MQDLVNERFGHFADGFGFLIPDAGGDDVYLAARQMREVFHGDRLAVRIKGYDRRGRPEGTIAEVLQRCSTEIVGRYLRERGVGFVVPDNPRITHQVIVPDKNAGNARHGQLVLVDIVSPPSAVAQPVGRVSQVLGEPDAPGIETELAIHAHGLPHRWSTEVDREVQGKLDEAEAHRAGHQPDRPGVDERVGTEGVEPQAGGRGLLPEEAREVGVAVLAHGEELRLEGEVADRMSDDEGEEDLDRLEETDSAIVRLANQIIIDAYRRGASDIHIEPQEKEVTVRYRIDGMMKNIFKVGQCYLFGRI